MRVGCDREGPTSVGPKDRSDGLAARPEVVPSRLPANRASTGPGLTCFNRALADRENHREPETPRARVANPKSSVYSLGEGFRTLLAEGVCKKVDLFVRTMDAKLRPPFVSPDCLI
jgi:hypothetical protein